MYTYIGATICGAKLYTLELFVVCDFIEVPGQIVIDTCHRKV